MSEKKTKSKLPTDKLMAARQALKSIYANQSCTGEGIVSECYLKHTNAENFLAQIEAAGYTLIKKDENA